MIIGYSHDGDVYTESEMRDYNFILNSRDLSNKTFYDENIDQIVVKDDKIFNFVGFLLNENNDIYVIFPKHYRVENIEQDSRLLFKCITMHMQKKPYLYIGEMSGFNSNYPFNSFFSIYDYYSKYGLYKEEEYLIKKNGKGKINWKKTIDSCSKFFIDDDLVIYPYYFKTRNYINDFITDCMVYAINYTIDKFNLFLSFDRIEYNYDITQWNSFSKIIKILEYKKNEIFKDMHIKLVNDLIDFFSRLNKGGTFYFKHYSFSAIWEDMIENYLNKKPFKMIENRIVFDDRLNTKFRFTKRSFYPNLAKYNQYISIDHYYENGGIQFIFDAKYYNNIFKLDYKQLCYAFILDERRESINDSKKKFEKTYVALVIPSEMRKSKIHFQINPIFSTTFKNLIVVEEYLDIREVIDEYIV